MFVALSAEFLVDGLALQRCLGCLDGPMMLEHMSRKGKLGSYLG